MKILLINDIGRATGGAEIQMLSLRQGLRDRGHDVRLFSSRASLVEDNRSLADYSCFGSNTKLQVLTQTANPSAYIQLKQILREFQPDIVHIRIFLGQLSPLILPLLKNIPCIYQMAMYRAICPIGTKILPDGSFCLYSPGLICWQQGCLTLQSWAALMVQRKLYLSWRSAIDRVVALSYGMKKELERGGIDSVEVIYNGVPERVSRPPLSNPPTVVYAGRLVAAKGVDWLIKAFAIVQSQLPEARLLIAGEGAEKENLQALASSLNISQSFTHQSSQRRITWLGYLPRPEIEQKFNSAWVQVVPSLWAGPFGNVTTEAMMRGTAVVASAVGAQPEIVVDGQTGFLVSPGDIKALAETLIKLLANQQLAEDMGKAGRQRALTVFSEDNRTNNFLALYQRLTEKYHQLDRLAWH